MLVLVLVLMLMLMLVLVLVLLLLLLLLLLMLPLLMLSLVLPLVLLILRVRVHCLISNRQNIIDGQHTLGWLTEPQTVEGLFSLFGHVLAMASSEHANNNGDQAEDKSEAND